MKTHPILFSADMVNAILNGRKTMTRRIMKPQPEPRPEQADKHWWPSSQVQMMVDVEDFLQSKEDSTIAGCFCPYGKPGDVLWVRETFRLFNATDECGCSEAPCPCPRTGTPLYRASHDAGESKWKPSIFMPRAISRITLEITEVRVERLQDISKEDAIAEGIQPADFPGTPSYIDYLVPGTAVCDPRKSFGSLWASINGLDSWNANPWVWCINFSPIFKNVDEVINEKS